MRTFNRLTIFGFLGEDPKIVKKVGRLYCLLNICSEDYTTKEKALPTWFKVHAFGRLADTIVRCLKKGSRVFVTAKFITKGYVDNNNKKRRATYLNIIDIQFINIKKRPETELQPDIIFPDIQIQGADRYLQNQDNEDDDLDFGGAIDE